MINIDGPIRKDVVYEEHMKGVGLNEDMWKSQEESIESMSDNTNKISSFQTIQSKNKELRKYHDTETPPDCDGFEKPMGNWEKNDQFKGHKNENNDIRHLKPPPGLPILGEDIDRINENSDYFSKKNLEQFIGDENEEDHDDSISDSSSFQSELRIGQINKEKHAAFSIYQNSSSRSPSKSEDMTDSIESIFMDYVEHFKGFHYKEQNSDLSPVDHQSFNNKFVGIEVFNTKFQQHINDYLLSNGFLISYTVEEEDNKNYDYKIRYLLQRSDGNGKKTLGSANFIIQISESLSQDQFSAPDPLNKALNYGIFLVLQRSFPSLSNKIVCWNIRSALHLNTDFKPILSPQDRSASLIIQETQKDSPSYDNPHLSNSRTPPFSADEKNKSTNDSNISIDGLLSSIENIYEKKYQPKSNEDTYVRNKWKKIDISSPAFFKDKLSLVSSCTLHSIYYHVDHGAKLINECDTSQNNVKSYEVFIIKLREFLDSKNFASIANNIFQALKMRVEPITIGDMTVYSINGNRSIIIRSKCQNKVERNKFCGLIMTRLVLEDVFDRIK